MYYLESPKDELTKIKEQTLKMEEILNTDIENPWDFTLEQSNIIEEVTKDILVLSKYILD